ncbi:23S rRNA (adenine(2058)-N(6))-methyltransferase Erm(B), partial [Ruminococcus sp. B05]
FTKNQFHQAMKHAKVNNLSTVTYEQVLSIFKTRQSKQFKYRYL